MHPDARNKFQCASTGQEAVRNTQYWRLKDSNGKPPGKLTNSDAEWRERGNVALRLLGFLARPAGLDADSRSDLPGQPRHGEHPSPLAPQMRHDETYEVVDSIRYLLELIRAWLGLA